MTDGIAGSHLVRYGTAADQKFLAGEFLETYDQLVINANMVAFMPSALATLVTQKVRKPYFIDPQTHAFQHASTNLESSKTGEIKRSIRTLINAYGEPVSTATSKQEAVLPSDFDDDATRDGFCDRVLAFQEQRLKSEVQDSAEAKYYKYLEEEGLAAGFDTVRPSLLVAPYFYMDARTGPDWLPVNIACARYALSVAATRGLPVAVQVVIAKEVLQSNFLKTLIAGYKALHPATFLVWIDDLAEDDAPEELLRAEVDFLKALGETTPVVNLYGGYFSIALMRTRSVPSMVGVTHSLEYGESRPVVPVGGGVPVAKFYLPAIHSRLVIRDALRAIRLLDGFASREKYLATICDCDECQEVIGGNPEVDFATYGVTTKKQVKSRGGLVTREYPTTPTKEHCVSHYMRAKAREYVDTASAKETAEALRAVGGRLRRALPDDVAHCQVWAKVLDG